MTLARDELGDNADREAACGQPEDFGEAAAALSRLKALRIHTTRDVMDALLREADVILELCFDRSGDGNNRRIGLILEERESLELRTLDPSRQNRRHARPAGVPATEVIGAAARVNM